MRRQLDAILAKHTGQPLARIQADTERDHFIGAQEAVAYGLIDEVLTQRDALPKNGLTVVSGSPPAGRAT